MYPNKSLNKMIMAAGMIALLLCWLLILQQIAIGDKQFLKSMIPHHAGAILMCEKASIQDKQLQALCRQITSGQQAEIAQMKILLGELKK